MRGFSRAIWVLLLAVSAATASTCPADEILANLSFEPPQPRYQDYDVRAMRPIRLPLPSAFPPTMLMSQGSREFQEALRDGEERQKAWACMKEAVRDTREGGAALIHLRPVLYESCMRCD